VSSEAKNSQVGQQGEEKEPPVAERDGCTRAGCGPAITLHAPLSDAVAALPSLSVDICFNDACLSGTLRITYVERYPNGKGCTPRCLTATLDVENSVDSE
jgi:hypothetical protein